MHIDAPNIKTWHPLITRGVPVCNRHQEEGKRGSGESSFSGRGGAKGWRHTSMSQAPMGGGSQGVGDRDESPFPRRGRETVMSHPFQGGMGGPWWVILSKQGVEGPWWVIQRGRVPREGGSTNHSQGEGVGADYVNVPLQNKVSPRTVLILKKSVRSAHYTTPLLLKPCRI